MAAHTVPLLPWSDQEPVEHPPAPPTPYDNAALLTVDDVARILRIAPGTLRNWCYRRQIPHVKLHNSLRFRADQIHALIAQGSRPARSLAYPSSGSRTPARLLAQPPR